MHPRTVYSRRPCPLCGNRMQYQASLFSWLLQLYRRVCLTCRYEEPKRIKLLGQR